jgi:hypothetical protein
MEAIEGMNRTVVSTRDAEQRADAVRKSVLGLTHGTGVLTKDDMLGYLRDKGVSESAIDQTFLKVYQDQLNRYQLNASRYYAATGGKSSFEIKDVSEADIFNNKTILANWPV